MEVMVVIGWDFNFISNDYSVTGKGAPKEKVIIQKVPVEKIVEVEKPQTKIPGRLKGVINEALKHARRDGIDVSGFPGGLFED